MTGSAGDATTAKKLKSEFVKEMEGLEHYAVAYASSCSRTAADRLSVFNEYIQ